MSTLRLEDEFTWSEVNALRVIVDDHAGALRAKFLLAQERGVDLGAAESRSDEAERLSKKVLALFYRVSDDERQEA